MAILVAGLLSASAAFADYQDDIVRQLQGMGFSRIEVSRTLLGRVRITAIGADGSREIILNPNTGEILRDLWSRPDGKGEARTLLDDRPREGDDGRARTDQRSSGSDGNAGTGGSGSNSGSSSGSNAGSNSAGSSNSGGTSGGRSGGSDHGSGRDSDSGRGGGKDGGDDSGKGGGSDDDGGDDD